VNTIQMVALGDGRGMESVYFSGRRYPSTQSIPLVLHILSSWIPFALFLGSVRKR
jgi:hypothetical protein